MKSLAKMRQEQQKNAQRDAAAFSVILWFCLNTIAGELKYGQKRLQRLYDGVLELMYSNRDDVMVGYLLEDWAIKNGLTEEAYRIRRAEKYEALKEDSMNG